MRTSIRSLVTLVVMCFTALTISAQKRPDFSGTWVEDESQRKSPYDAPAAGGGRIPAVRSSEIQLIIAQTPEQITIDRVWSSRYRHVYDFDGRQNTNRNGAQTHTTRSKWDGDRLVIEGSTYQVTSQGETSWKLREVRWLTPKGEMVVETTRADEDGEPRTVLRVYRRKK